MTEIKFELYPVVHVHGAGWANVYFYGNDKLTKGIYLHYFSKSKDKEMRWSNCAIIAIVHFIIFKAAV